MRRKPTYLRQRQPHGRPDQAYVRIDGEKIYLGRYDSEESHANYRRVVAEAQQAGGRVPLQKDAATVVEICDRYLHFARKYYSGPDRKVTREFEHLVRLTKLLTEHFGKTPAIEFGPRRLKALREVLIERGNARSYINSTVNRVRRIFLWAVEEELLSSSVPEALRAVKGLRRNRSRAREGRRVKPVPVRHIKAIEPYVSRQVWAVVRLQLFTGARSGELLSLRKCDIKRRGDVWRCIPQRHKTSYLGRDRVLLFGKRAQKVLKPFLRSRDKDAYLFSPCEAEEQRRRKATLERKTPASCGNIVGSKRRGGGFQRVVRECYDVHSYRRAIVRACKAAGVPTWHPHQLRHNAATLIRREFDLDAARAVLGHSSVVVTTEYAELDERKALAVVEKIG